MDSFLIYLIVINVITFLAFALDLFLCLKYPGLEDHVANALILDVFPVMGGAAGMVLALFVLTGLGRGHRMNKDNIAWWFLAFVCLIVWALVIAAKYGVVKLDPSIAGIITGWNLKRLKILGFFLAAINVITFIAFALDKAVAESGNNYGLRTPEARLLGLCLIGGSIGGMLAMYIVRHKTRKWYFVWGLPLFIIINIATIMYAHLSGLI